MIEWVNCLKLKLRELKILSPKENIYTKPPGMKPILQTTRNPRDPLPLRPMNVSEIPGLELIEATEQANSESSAEEEVLVHIGDQRDVQVENLLEALNILDVDEDAPADPITIPVFNFSTSNTTSQNLINLLSNPLRHTSNVAPFTPFDDVFINESDDLEDDEVEAAVHEDVPPTSLQIDYVPEEDVQQQSLHRDNITVIKIAEREPIRKVHDPKVTKIKIELDYEQPFKALSVPVKNEEPVEVKTIETHIQTPSTSSSNTSSEIEIHEIPKPVVEKPIPVTPRKPPPTPKKTPAHDKRKLSLREKQVQQLSHEINTEIRFKLRKKDCVDAIAFVTAFGSIWIAGFKSNPLLYCLHVGDQLLAINNIVIKCPADAQKYIKMCSGLFVEVTIRRLPLAGIFLIRREFEGQCLGIIRDGSSPAIVEIIPNSISSHIPPRPIDEESTWIITQINFRNLSLISHKKYDETELLLNSSGLELSLLLQPSGFIAKIKKELKAMKNYRDYTLQ